MHVVVAIVGFRNAGDISQCLNALGASRHTDIEVVICENGGPEAFDLLVAKLPINLPGGQGVRAILAPKNLGYAGGVNVCLAETPQADAWWVLNPDTLPEPGALEGLVARLAQGDCDAVGCTVYLPNNRIQSYGGQWRPWSARTISLGLGEALDKPIDALAVERDQTYLNGASMLMSRRFVEAVGPMRQDYFLYCEEVEWCQRGLNRGMRLGFSAQGRVFHNQGSTTGAGGGLRQRARTPVYLSERNLILVTRDCFPRRLPVAALAALARLFVQYVRQGGSRQLVHGLAGWWAGLRGERGVPLWI